MGADDGEVNHSLVFRSGLFIPTILLLLCLTTKAYFKVEDEAVCAGVRWFGLVNQPTFTERAEDVKDVTVERKWVGKKSLAVRACHAERWGKVEF